MSSRHLLSTSVAAARRTTMLASAEADGPDRLRASFYEVLRTGQMHTMDMQRYDVPSRKGDGFIVKYWLPTNLPVLDADGRVSAILHRVYDMTALVNGDAALPTGDPFGQRQRQQRGPLQRRRRQRLEPVGRQLCAGQCQRQHRAARHRRDGRMGRWRYILKAGQVQQYQYRRQT